MSRQAARNFRTLAPLIGLPHRGVLASKGTDADLPVLSITGPRDPTVPPREWEDPPFTVPTDGDRYFYTRATAITRVWAEAHGCETTPPAKTFEVGIAALDCRADARQPSLSERTWPLVIDFFDAHRQGAGTSTSNRVEVSL